MVYTSCLLRFCQGGRQILDLVLTTKEAINSRLKNGLNGMISKVNTEKAYNHVSWDYLLEILNKMNFCHNRSVRSNRAS